MTAMTVYMWTITKTPHQVNQCTYIQKYWKWRHCVLLIYCKYIFAFDKITMISLISWSQSIVILFSKAYSFVVWFVSILSQFTEIFKDLTDFVPHCDKMYNSILFKWWPMFYFFNSKMILLSLADYSPIKKKVKLMPK